MQFLKGLGNRVKVGIERAKRGILPSLLGVSMILFGGGIASAQTSSTHCDAVNSATSAAPPEISDIVGCTFEKVNIFTFLMAILLLSVPGSLAIWGIRGGFQTIWGLLKRGFAAISKTGG